QVQAGKQLRITLVTVTIRNVTTATLVSTRVRIRQAASVANTSPIVFEAEVGMVPAASLENTTTVACPIPEGLDVDAGQQIAGTEAQGNPAESGRALDGAGEPARNAQDAAAAQADLVGTGHEVLA